MSDIAKGILSGGWSLVAGWILPTAINVLMFWFLVLPSLHSVSAADHLSHASATERSLTVFAIAVVIGLVLSALQTPLYRILEGYLLWPGQIARKRIDRQRNRKHLIQDRLDFIRLSLADKAQLASSDESRLAELSQDRRLAGFAKRDKARTTVQRSLLRERLRRYPVNDDQVAPTRLGNAIRRLEEYGFDRYQLDSQSLWYELTAVVPKQVRQQIDAARAGVDFFVCLLYGNLCVAIISLVSLGAPKANSTILLVTFVVLLVLMPGWYRLALTTTDDWALAVRALVDLGRKPVAEGVGLCLPKELEREREMWRRYSRLVRQPHSASRATELDEFRCTDLPGEPPRMEPGKDDEILARTADHDDEILAQTADHDANSVCTGDGGLVYGRTEWRI